MKILLTLLIISALSVGTLAQMATRKTTGTNLPNGYWPSEKSQAIVDKTQTVRLSPDLAHLTEGERKAVAKLLEAGKIFQELYEQQRHARALASQRELAQLDKRTGSHAATQNLLMLYRLFQGPVATTLENKREPFLPLDMTPPGQNLYPWGITKEEVEAFFAAHPEKRDSLLDLRTVVRRAVAENLRRDVGKLRQYPALSTLHPGLQRELEVMLARPRPKDL
ncbi:MAG TPA: hypothetical protein VF666_10630 [Pyrinomonadaceae bacterium]|jgi:hypothetical protein